MEEAKKLVQKMPGTPRGHSPSPIHLPDPSGSTIVELLNEITEETRDLRTPVGTRDPKKPGAGGNAGGTYASSACVEIDSFAVSDRNSHHTFIPKKR